MIQVCSRCWTRWNVRDRQRHWCPRCQSALLPPGAAQPPRPVASGSRLPQGFRWIAVRPGAPPPRRRPHRPLGPTPRYTVTPRWGFVDPATMRVETTTAAQPRRGPSQRAVGATLITTIAALGIAAVLHIARYVLLIINRDTLLNPIVAAAGTWLAVVASAGAALAVVGCAFVLTEWLIARRVAAFAQHDLPDPRRVWALRAGCLVPVLNFVFAPVYVIELAVVEERYLRLRRPIAVWWVLFVVSTFVSVFATATSFPRDGQGIANNTVSFIVAYLVAMSTVIMIARVWRGFERSPVERTVRRWLAVPDAAEPPPPASNAAEASSEDQEPAA